MLFKKFTCAMLCAIALCMCNLQPAVQAQAPDAPVTPPAAAIAETPESVAARYMEAIRRQDWHSAATLMHPDALKQMKGMFRPIIFHAPDVQLPKMFFNVSTAAEFDQLSDVQAYERLMVAITKMNPDMTTLLGTSKTEIIGHVLEGADTAHIVYRMTVKTGDINVTKMAIMPMKKQGASWGGLLTGDIEGLAAVLSRMAKPTPKSTIKPDARPDVKPNPKPTPKPAAKSPPKPTPKPNVKPKRS